MADQSSKRAWYADLSNQVLKFLAGRAIAECVIWTARHYGLWP